MNISRIRQMAVNGDISKETTKYLIECHCECEHLDYKIELDLESDYHLANVSKDILAMKNVGGGYLIIGVEDKSWKAKGIDEKNRYETKTLRDKIRKAIGLDIDIYLTYWDLSFGSELNTFAIVLIRSSAKRNKLKMPTLVKSDFNPSENWGIRRGDIYIRVGDTTKKLNTEEELANLLDDLESKYNESDLEELNKSPSPFAVEAGLFRLLHKDYDYFIGRDKYKDILKKAIESDPRLWIINIHGPGGVGKSALATWMAYDYYHNNSFFEAIIQLSAKDLKLTSAKGICHLQPTLVSLEDLLDRILSLFEHGEHCSIELSKKKEIVFEILTAYKTLIILDNMETVSDGRIMEFVRSLPQGSSSKFVITSRKRTTDWEYPIQIAEFDLQETGIFINYKFSKSLNTAHNENEIISKIFNLSGGLPLSIEWIMGEFLITNNLQQILERVVSKDSPLLEFSFRNSWDSLDDDSKMALAIIPIFEVNPTKNDWSIALDWSIERLEKAISSLVNISFIIERIDDKTGQYIYGALPITMTFARNELSKYGRLEINSRERFQTYQNKVNLSDYEVQQYSDIFDKFDAKTDLQKKAIIYSIVAEGHIKTSKIDLARESYSQALDLDPQSVYSLVSYAIYNFELNHYSESIDLFNKASQYCTKKSGFHVYYNFSRVYDQLKDRSKKISVLTKALTYEPNNIFAKHSLGVAMSQIGKKDEAIRIFDEIIENELNKKSGPSSSLLYAYKTKFITLRKDNKKDLIGKLLPEAISMLKKYSFSESRIKELEDLFDESE